MKSKINARNKGKRGERQVIDWLQPIIDTVCPQRNIMLQRNTLQSDCGGFDIVGLDWLAAEVKNCEADGPATIDKWWEQCERQAEKFRRADGSRRIPVLFYKRNNRAFRVRMRGGAGEGDEWVACIVDISAEIFEAWFTSALRSL